LQRPRQKKSNLNPQVVPLAADVVLTLPFEAKATGLAVPFVVPAVGTGVVLVAEEIATGAALVVVIVAEMGVGVVLVVEALSMGVAAVVVARGAAVLAVVKTLGVVVRFSMTTGGRNGLVEELATTVKHCVNAEGAIRFAIRSGAAGSLAREVGVDQEVMAWTALGMGLTRIQLIIGPLSTSCMRKAGALSTGRVTSWECVPVPCAAPNIG